MRRLKKNLVRPFRRILVRLEDKLEQKASYSSNRSSGWWIAAQQLRKRQSIILDGVNPAVNLWTHETIELDTRHREIVQRETYIIEKIRQARQPAEKVDNMHQQQRENQQVLNEWFKELETLNQDYWAVERRIYIHNNCCPSAPFKRAGIFLLGYAKTVQIVEVAVAELVDAVKNLAVTSAPLVMAIVPSFATAAFGLVVLS
ncbi:hypothetical protein N7476_008047 [Penicillium atrosanguineum]|uniref:Uncharacterized protein n=1 Tax=Penicillium atrosanguineum TaxID=1132637 RepID=A0A9W9PQZ5_9EURO|nr:hypothetical protein N7526_004117 [Penicillium atrosanguineum]KAJ5307391.1 hypothetical protein N7476_008047 [Penicillium atrosanguineum]